MTVADVTLPAWAKNSRSPSLVVENERLPTKSFCAMGGASVFRLLGGHVAGRGSGPRRGLRCEGSRLNRRSNQTSKVYTPPPDFSPPARNHLERQLDPTQHQTEIHARLLRGGGGDHRRQQGQV